MGRVLISLKVNSLVYALLNCNINLRTITSPERNKWKALANNEISFQLRSEHEDIKIVDPGVTRAVERVLWRARTFMNSPHS